MVEIADGVNLRDLWEQMVEKRGDQIFLIFEDPDTGQVRTFTYNEFWTNTRRVANMMWSRNVRPGDRVAVHLYNSVEFLECLFGLASIGAIAVPLNAAYAVAEIKHILGTCDVRIIVTEPELLAAVTAADANGADVIVVGEYEGYPSYSQLCQIEPERLCARPMIEATAPVEIMFTSGTTSRPKGVTLTHYNFIWSGLFVNWQLAMNQDDRYLTSMAASHVNLQLSALMPALTAGATLILEKRYSASRFWRQVRTHRATLVQGMAMIIRTLMAQPVDPVERDHVVREVHYFLQLTDPEKVAFEQRFGVTLLNNYGSTESLVGCLTDTPFGARRWPSIGRVGLGYSARIVDEEGREVPAGQVGEIQVRGKIGRTLMAGYWDDPVSTFETIDADGWLKTLDCGYVDIQGWFYFVDRKCDLIKRAGENVSSTEVEDVLLRYPQVKEAAVVGMPDPIRDEVVAAFVVPFERTTLDVADLLEHCKAHLAYFKVPTLVEIRDELPRGNYGKVQKKLLANQERTCHGNQH